MLCSPDVANFVYVCILNFFTEKKWAGCSRQQFYEWDVSDDVNSKVVDQKTETKL